MIFLIATLTSIVVGNVEISPGVMKLNKAQFEQFVDNYSNHIIDGLDNDSMEVMLFDLLTSQYGNYTQEFIVREIEELYGEEVAQDLLESATDVSQS
jgi:hypothetical protein